MMNNCIFCNLDNIKENVLWQSDNFFVKVGVGILGPGHVMLISKSHIRCFGDLPTELEEEFLSEKQKIAERLRASFSEPLIFEHGTYSQSIRHAHLHFLPKKGRLYSLENLAGKIFTELKSEEVKDIFQVRELYRKEKGYIYLEENGKKVVFHTKGQPEGKFTFRKEFARLTGIKGLHKWQIMGEKERQRDKEWVSQTKERLKE